jgi:hypothetical protein
MSDSAENEQAINPAAEVETRKHIARVSELLHLVVKQLLDRADKHDRSKTESPEVETFASYTDKLASCTYGSEEYQQFLTEMQEGCLSHHYAKNRHHPEHFPNGVSDMTLIDLAEMLMDWKAASERHHDGNILKSIEHNKERFKISGQLAKVLVNTVEAFGFVEG